MSRPTHAPKQLHLDGVPAIHPHAAGMDIGADEIVVAVPPDRDPQPVRAFATFTPDLHALVAWLVAGRIDTVALESTGVYWIPIYELLEQHGITPIWSTRATSRPFLAGRAIGMMPNGCKNCMRWACSRPPFAPMMRLPPCVCSCAIVPN